VSHFPPLARELQRRSLIRVKLFFFPSFPIRMFEFLFAFFQPESMKVLGGVGLLFPPPFPLYGKLKSKPGGSGLSALKGPPLLNVAEQLKALPATAGVRIASPRGLLFRETNFHIMSPEVVAVLPQDASLRK